MAFSSIVFFVTLIVSCSATSFAGLSHPQQKALFEGFKSKFNKVYSTMDEETHRFNNFVENLRLIDHRNELEIRHNGSPVHGITKFSDLSQVEFESHYLTADVSMKSKNAQVFVVDKAPDASLGLVDWTGKYTTDVKDQGYCGSCWAFSATEQIETDAMRQLGVTYLLSPEQITQCTTAAFGCSGGWTETAYTYVKRAGGMELDKDYPYTSYNGVTGTCSATSSKFVVGISSYSTISGESQMASYVQTSGPLSVCVDANNWNSYSSGIMSVCGTSVDHCVQAVGVDAATGGYWKVRNSWNTNWGELGFIRLAYGANTCAITNDPTFVTVSSV